MLKLAFFFVFVTAVVRAAAQIKTPDQLWGQLFEEVQTKRALGDNKSFVDMVPQEKPALILKKYQQLKLKDSASLRKFILDHFYLPVTPAAVVQQGQSINKHLQGLWNTLTRQQDKKLSFSSLLPLPNAYIVPGGRFREIYYWDSYFTMLGLASSNRYDLIEKMVENFAYLIRTYGHIPNGNRSYYLSRSQPPYFALMVDLLAEHKGKAVYKKYFQALSKEYSWWMSHKQNFEKVQAQRRLVQMPDGSLLNRYFDDKDAPREESYAEDLHTASAYVHQDGKVFTHLRAGAESGWDFSSRWLADTAQLASIETTNIIPVDLNCLLYAYEQVLQKAAAAMNSRLAAYYGSVAEKRKKSILTYCWNPELQFFFDYRFTDGSTTNRWSLAGLMPLFVGIASPEQAAAVQKHVAEKFLKDGGLVSTTYHTGQQWDAPNGWAPLQYLSVKALMNYGYNDMARTIAERWMAMNEKVFKATGKMMEKYNVENTQLESGGGEYPNQDGFGWTNGVYLKFQSMFEGKKGF